MSYQLSIYTEDGVIVGRLLSGWGPELAISPHTAVAEYQRRFDRVRDRNPDMSDLQVQQYVLQRWYEEVDAARKGSE